MTNINKSGEMTLKELILSIQLWCKYLYSKWMILLIITILGGAIGWVISFFSPNRFVAETNVVLEGTNSGGGLSAVFGIEGEQSSGLFSSTDNIVWLYTNGRMIREALLSLREDGDEKKELLIDRFIKTSPAVKKLIKDNRSFKGLHFSSSNQPYSIEQEKFIKACVSIIKSDYIDVNTIEKTENIVGVKIKAEDEDFAYGFCNGLVKTVNNFYITTKSQKSLQNVERLSAKADSFKRNMSASMLSTAISIDRIPYANPNINTLRVEAQKGNVDVQSTTALYMQVVQSLEAAKNELARETPVVQVVDVPIKPLHTDKIRLIPAVILGTILGTFLSCVILILRKSYRNIVNDTPSTI